MKKISFQVLARLNKIVLPRYSKRDITRLTKMEKVIVAYRYWVTIHAIE
jgi:hypothetical protein